LPDRPAVVDLLAALDGVLCRRGLRWYLFGAQAVTLWGRPRLSAHVDVTVEIPLSEVPSLIEQMRSAGFELRVRSDVDAFVRQTRLLEQALDQSDLLPAFEVELARSRES
jgi:hypothetical protein